MIPDVALVDNTEQRTPLVLVLDCSGSMDGEPVSLLNEGLALLEQELKADVIAAKRVRILVIQYGAHDEAVVASNWCDAMDFTAPVLSANGTTPTARPWSWRWRKSSRKSSVSARRAWRTRGHGCF